MNEIMQLRELGRPPRILITRLSAIGDCIHTLPLLTAIKRQYPDAHLAWLTQGGPATLIRGHQHLDQLIVVSKDWMKSPRQILALQRQLAALNFDATVDPQSLTKSSLTAWLSGASMRIGFARPQGREISPWLNNVCVHPRRSHVVQRYLELLSPLGIERSQVKFGVPLRDVAQDFAEKTIVNGQLENGFAVVNPGAGWGSKIWPPDRYGQVAKHLSHVYGLPSLVVWAGEVERQAAEQIVLESEGSGFLAPATSLPELAATVAKAQLFVGSDTGPLHLAAALDIPCVGLYGPTIPEVCGPYGLGHKTVQAYHQDGNNRQRRGNNNAAMQAIRASDVCAACDEVLSGSSHTRAVA